MKVERRQFERKKLHPLEIQGIIATDSLTPIADGGTLVQASIRDFSLEVHRDNLCDPFLKKNLHLHKLEGLQVSILIPAMNLDVIGKITHTRYCGNSKFKINIDYSVDAPQYWRECLCELLPKPGELEASDG